MDSGRIDWSVELNGFTFRTRFQLRGSTCRSLFSHSVPSRGHYDFAIRFVNNDVLDAFAMLTFSGITVAHCSQSG